MTMKLRRPARPTTRPRFAEGGAVGISPTPPVQHVDDRPEAAHAVGARSLRGSGIDQPTAAQTAHVAHAVAQDRSRGAAPGNVEAAVSQARQMHQPVPGLPPSIQAALALRPSYARGGSIAPGLPAAPFLPVPTPTIATPGLASPHGLIAAHRRAHFATGGPALPALPAHILAALALRPHFDDGGEAGGDSNRSGGSGTGNGDGNGDSGDGHGASNSNSSTGNSDGNGNGDGGRGDGPTGGSNGGGIGGGFSSGAASGADSATTSGGAGGGVSGTNSNSDASSGGFSPGAASGADVGGTANVSGYGSATSGNVGSITGSVGAPAAGGFSNPGAPATGGFGNFGAGPAASDTTAGLSGGTVTASSLSGQTAAQSMANEARSAGEAGEDGTGAGGLGYGPSTGQAFNSFGPSPASPYGTTANAQATFGGTTAGDLGNVAGLSPMGQQLGAIGLGAMPGGMAENPNGFASPGAYGLSTTTGGITPGFDNFSAAGNVQQSSLGPQGYTGFGGNVDPNASYSTFGGVTSGAMVNAMAGDLPGAEAHATDLSDLSRSFTPDYSGFTLGPDGKPTFAGNVGVFNDTAAGLKGLGGVFGGTTSTPSTGGVPGAGLGMTPTSATPSLNADGDPTAVGDTAALTIHGDLSPSAQTMMSGLDPSTLNGVPQVHTFAGVSPSYADAVGRPANAVYNAASLSNDTGTRSMPAFATMGTAPQTPGMGPASLGPDLSFGSPSGETSEEQLSTAAGSSSGARDASDPASQPGQPPSLTVSGVPGVPNDSYHIGVHTIEGGVLNGQVDPNNPTHYGPAQFSQATWSGVARAHPELGLPASMYAATAGQYASATQALTQENRDALAAAGLPVTPANLYMVHNLGAPVGIAALQAGPDATLSQAGIPGSYVRSNPSIYGGVQTVGQVQARVASMLEKGAAGASTATPAQPAITVHSLGEAMGTGSPAVAAGLGINGVAPGVPTKTGIYGTAAAHDYATPQGFTNDTFTGAAATGRVADPASLSTFGAMAGAAFGVGQKAGDANPSINGAMPTSMLGITNFDGSPTTYGASPASSTSDTSAGTPDTSTSDIPAPSHLSVPEGITNTLAGVGLGALGPLGLGIAGANAISGWLGGPTIGSALNGILAGSGGGTAPSSGGQGDNSSQPGADSYGATLPAAYGPSPGSTDGSSGSTDSSAPSGVSPLDPHAAAMAAYQAAINGEGSSSGAASPDALAGYRNALTIRGAGHHALATSPATPLYNPMQDPSVLRALGMD